MSNTSQGENPVQYNVWRVVLVLLLAVVSMAAVADARYGGTIGVAPGTGTETKAAAGELARWLGQMTGAAFTVGAQGEITLATVDSPNLPVDTAQLRAQASPEAFLLHGDTDALWIIGRGDLGVARGVYWYLDRLGCRFLHANERWTIIPTRADITLTLDTLQAPAFFQRNFFGTGGFGRPTIDPTQRLAQSWEQYKRRNLLGGTVSLAGHTGEAFNAAHKAEMEAHPEYRAELNGVRQPYAPGTKLCVSNPELQALYVQDRLNALKLQLARDPNTVAVSVEPADGGGHCDCAECRKLGSISDRVFTLANVVARAVAKAYPGKYVSLYAYNEHAMVPTIDLEPNIIVSVAAYAFQRTGLTPHELIGAWGKKHGYLGIYTYWNIPDWARCLPELSTTSVVGEIRFWRDSHVKVHLSESTYCGGNMGPNWYLASRLMWDPDRDAQAVLDDYFTQAFGPARAPIRRLYARWDDGFLLTDHEVALCHHDVREALTLAKDDPAVTARVVDLARYVHFLRLWYEYTSARGTEARAMAAEAVATYLWGIYESNMVQSFRMVQLLNRDVKPALEVLNPNDPRWKDYPQLTDAQVLERFAGGEAAYQPLPFTARRFTGTLAPRPLGPGAGWVTTTTFASSAGFAFARPEGAASVTLKITVNKSAGRTDNVQVTGPDGATVFAQRLEADGALTELVIPTPAAGVYHMQVTDQKTFFTLQIPADLPFVCTGPYTCPTLSARTYFYVPRGLRQVAVYSPGAIALTLYDSTGKPVTVERNTQQNPLFLIDIPDGQDGKAWSFARYKSYTGLRLLNAPNIFAFSPAGMMVPADAE